MHNNNTIAFVMHDVYMHVLYFAMAKSRIENWRNGQLVILNGINIAYIVMNNPDICMSYE